MTIYNLIRESVRFQALLLIAHASPASPATPRELSRRLGLPSESCEEVLEELAEEGFVDPLPGLRLTTGPALHLTPMGEGWVRWVEQHRELRT